MAIRPALECSGPVVADARTLPRVPNGFTTATHFSRLHLAMPEAAILAVTTDDFRPARDLYARLGPDELAARRDLLPALRERVRAWAGPDW